MWVTRTKGTPSLLAALMRPAVLCATVLPPKGTAHSMDFVRFGPDGALYVSDGDGIVNSKGNSRALNPDSLNGKILRINPITGEGYPDNPFFDGDPNSNRSKVFAMGMRNPFRFTVDPRDGQVIVGDVGNNNWEEINRGGPGSNFGWPCYEGPYEAATYANCDAYKSGASPITMPIYSYPHSVSNPIRGSAIGGDLYLGSAFPALYRGAYFFHDFNGGVVDFLTFNADGSANDNEFATNVPGVVQMTVGDDGALYVISVILGGIWRIRYAPGGNKPPTADATADPMGGPAPLDVTFSSKRSTDPEKSIVGYQWDFGDGDTSSKANPTYTYEDNGVYTAVLTVTDSAGATSSDSLQIAVGSSPPVAEILEPGEGAKFRVGQTVNFEGKATDAEDGDLSGAKPAVGVTLHHLQHLHYDFFNGEGESGSFRFDDHGDDTYLELCLTATDSAGLQDTDCSNIKADEVTYTFNTVPAGLPITYAGSRYETPFKVKTYIDAKRIIEAPAETKDGLRFDSWSDGGEAVHEIVIGESPQTLTATYVDASGTAAGDQAASDKAAADAAIVTPEDTGQTTGAAPVDDGHDHGATGEAATPEPTPEVSTSAGDTAAPARGFRRRPGARRRTVERRGRHDGGRADQEQRLSQAGAVAAGDAGRPAAPAHGRQGLRRAHPRLPRPAGGRRLPFLDCGRRPRCILPQHGRLARQQDRGGLHAAEHQRRRIREEPGADHRPHRAQGGSALLLRGALQAGRRQGQPVGGLADPRRRAQSDRRGVLGRIPAVTRPRDIHGPRDIKTLCYFSKGSQYALQSLFLFAPSHRRSGQDGCIRL